MKAKIITLTICGFLFCMFSSNLVMAQSITSTLGTGGLFTIKDGSSTFFSLSQATGHLSLSRNLILPNTTDSTRGVIYKGTSRFLHNYGTGNTFLGVNSGNFTMSGFGGNSAFGYQSLYSNTEGFHNSAFGNYSLSSNTTGYSNSAFGYNSLSHNTTGNSNTAVGYGSLFYNTTGIENSAFGTFSLLYNTTGIENSAFGYWSLHSNTTGYSNSAFGYSSLSSNTTGFRNTAVGDSSLYNNISSENTALGYKSLFSNTTGFGNIGIGILSGSTVTTGSNLVLIGYNSQPTTNSATNQITLGDNNITSLRCNVTTITSLSDMRDKKNIKDLSLGLDFITKIKPRLFNWDKREWYENNTSDGTKMQETPTAGFIAQELDEVQTTENAQWLNLVLKDNPEKWEATPGNLLPIMVKAIKELKSENDELKREVNELKTVNEKVAKLERILNELTAVRNVSLTQNK